MNISKININDSLYSINTGIFTGWKKYTISRTVTPTATSYNINGSFNLNEPYNDIIMGNIRVKPLSSSDDYGGVCTSSGFSSILYSDDKPVSANNHYIYYNCHFSTPTSTLNIECSVEIDFYYLASEEE